MSRAVKAHYRAGMHTGTLMRMAEPEPASQRSIPSLVVVNARAWTGEARQPWVDAVLVRDGRILALGSSAELRKRAGKGIPVLDAGGRMVVAVAGDGTLARGAPADFRILDGSTPDLPPAASEEFIVFAIRESRVLVDRGLLTVATTS